MGKSARLVTILALCVLAASAPGRAAEGGSTPVPLAEEPGRAERAGRLIFRGGLALRLDDPAFGGLSDLRIAADGRGFTAIGDRGAVVVGRLDYDREGRLAAARDLALRPLPDIGGWPLTYLRRDAEGLAPLPGGGWAVSFEVEHRVMRYPPGFDGPPQRLPPPEGVRGLPVNGGLEALAAWPDGGLVALAESRGADGLHAGWRWLPGTAGRGGDGQDGWQAFRYRAVEPFQPTGAAVLPDGDLLVLERRASWLGGLGARIVRVRAADLRPGATVVGEELGRIDPPQLMENFEGIDARPGPDGRILVYLLSDDNFEPLLRTVLLMFELPPP